MYNDFQKGNNAGSAQLHFVKYNIITQIGQYTEYIHNSHDINLIQCKKYQKYEMHYQQAAIEHVEQSH